MPYIQTGKRAIQIAVDALKAEGHTLVDIREDFEKIFEDKVFRTVVAREACAGELCGWFNTMLKFEEPVELYKKYFGRMWRAETVEEREKIVKELLEKGENRLAELTESLRPCTSVPELQFEVIMQFNILK